VPGSYLVRSCPRCSTQFADDSKFCPVDGTATIGESNAQAAADPLLGRTLGGRYRLERKLGEGGMGAVYEAEHTLLGKHVAVKVLLDAFTKQRDVLLRFQQEARTASTIGHENIIDIADIGEEKDGRWYIVMELLKGHDLAHELRGGGVVAPQRAASILKQICRALQAAHDKGIIHRDMKPENVFVTAHADNADFVKIMDFGISKVKQAHENVRLTQTGAVMGTPLYMAPEQARGDPDIDHRTDIYAVGVMAYEMFCGRPPFTGPTYIALLTQHLTEQPPRPSTICPGIAPELEAFLLRALEKDRMRRFGSMSEMAAALAAFAGGAMGAGPYTQGLPTAGAGAQLAAAGTIAPAAWPGSGPLPAGPSPGTAYPVAPAAQPPPVVGMPGAAPAPFIGGLAPAPPPPVGLVAAGVPGAPVFTPPAPRKSSAAKWVLLILLVALPVAGVAIFLAVQSSGTDSDPGKTVRTDVSKTVAKTVTTKHAMQKPHARVTIDSSPRGARVLIDNIPIGTTPATADVAPGHHQLAVELAGYRRVARALEVHDTKPISVPVHLEREASTPHPPRP
jgi:eukaryotic-like serine/threonine-protein kinase